MYYPSSDSFFVLVHLDDPLQTVGIATNDIENRVSELGVIICFSLNMNQAANQLVLWMLAVNIFHQSIS